MICATAKAASLRERRHAKFSFCILLGVCFFSSWSTDSLALQLRQITWHGHLVLLATGEIAQGDSQGLVEELQKLPSLPHGLRVVLLDSPGGSVAEAFRISEIFSHIPVHTVVPNGAKCVSACASIIFIAGKNRTIEEGGLIGQHSCARGGVSDQECNDSIAQYAVSKGVSHGSVAAFIRYAGPNEVVWFDRSQADCYGLTYYPYTEQSGFDKSEPCPIKAITGRAPRAQAAWRIDFEKDGYRAFIRPVSDEVRELELNIFCNNDEKGVLFISMDIEGASWTIRDAVTGASLRAPPIIYENAPLDVVQVDLGFSRVVAKLKPPDVSTFLRRANELELILKVKAPYKQISANTILANSRTALLFAANNCLSPR